MTHAVPSLSPDTAGILLPPVGSEAPLFSLMEQLQLQASFVVPPHAHPSSAEVYVVQNGGGTVEVGGVRRSLRAGDVVLVPRGALHSIHAGPEGLSFLSVMCFPTLGSYLLYRLKRVVQDTPWLARIHRAVRG